MSTTRDELAAISARVGTRVWQAYHEIHGTEFGDEAARDALCELAGCVKDLADLVQVMCERGAA